MSKRTRLSLIVFTTVLAFLMFSLCFAFSNKSYAEDSNPVNNQGEQFSNLPELSSTEQGELDELGIVMLNGASLRMNKTSPTLRFFGKLKAVNDAYSYGMIIMPYDNIATYSLNGNYHSALQGTNAVYTDVVCSPFEEVNDQDVNYYIRGAQTYVSYENIFTKYVAIGYINNNGQYTYATVDENNARSIADVAIATYELENYEVPQDGKDALEYFYNVAIACGEKAVLTDYFDGSEVKTTVWNGGGEVFSVSNFSYVTVTSAPETIRVQSKESYSDVKSIQYDLRFDEVTNGWFAMTSQNSVYACPYYFANKNGFISYGGTCTNTKSFSTLFGTDDLTNIWITFKYVVLSNNTAKVYAAPKGESLVEAFDISFSEAQLANNFANGFIKFGTAGSIKYSLDNFILTFNDNSTVVEDFDSLTDSIFNFSNTTLNLNKGLTLAPETDSYLSISGIGNCLDVQTEKYFNNIEYIQWDTRLTTNNNWRTISNCDSVYSGVYMYTTTFVSAGLTGTLPDTVYYSSIIGVSDISNKWVTFKYVVIDEKNAELYVALKGDELVKATDITFTDANKQYNFTSGRIGFGGPGDDLDIDNLIIKTNDETYIDFFNKSTSLFKPSSAITKISNYNGKNISDSACLSVTGAPDQVKLTTKNSYTNIEYVQFDFKLLKCEAPAWFTLTNTTSPYSGTVAFNNSQIYDIGIKGSTSTSNFSDVIGVSDITDTWITIKYVVTSDTTAEIWIAEKGNQLVKSNDITFSEANKDFNLKNGKFGIGDAGANEYLIDNLIIKTATNTYFDNFGVTTPLIAETPAIEVIDRELADFDATTELFAPYIQAKTAITYDENVSDSRPIAGIDVSYTAEEGGAFGIGFSNTEFISVSHKAGNYLLRLNKNGVYVGTPVTLSSLSNDLKITLNKNGTLNVKVNNGETFELGTVSISDLKVTLFSINWENSVNVTKIRAYSFVSFENTTLNLNITGLNMRTGGTYQLEPTIFGYGTIDNVSFISNDTDVVTVSDSGLVTAVGEGSTIIFVRIGKCEESVLITVNNNLGKYIVNDNFANNQINTNTYEVIGDSVVSNAEKTSYAIIEGVSDGVVGTFMESKEKFNNVQSIEYSLYTKNYTSWFGVSFYDSDNPDGSYSVYRTPATFFNTSLGANETTITPVNAVSYNTSSDWVTYKYVVTGESTADLYINGTKAYTISGYTGSGKSFKNCKISFSTSADTCMIYIDNIIIKYGEEQTCTEDFSKGFVNFVPHGNVTSYIGTGVCVDEKNYNDSADTFFTFGEFANVYSDPSATVLGSNPNYETTTYQWAYLISETSYSKLEEFKFDIKVSGSACIDLLFVASTDAIWWAPLKFYSNKVDLNSSLAGSGKDLSEATITKYDYDFTNWTTVKIVITDAGSFEVYIAPKGDELSKVFTVEIPEANRGSYAVSGACYPMFMKRTASGIVNIDNVVITNDGVSQTETFANKGANSIAYSTYGNSTTNHFDGCMYIKRPSALSSVFTRTVNKVYGNYSSYNGLVIKPEYIFEYIDKKDDVLSVSLDLELNNDKELGIVLGDDSIESKISLVIISANGVSLVNANATASTVVSAISGSIENGVTIKFNGDKEVFVKFGNGDYQLLGKASVILGNIKLIDVSGNGIGVISSIVINNIIYVEPILKENSQIEILAYSPFDSSDIKEDGSIDMTGEQLDEFIEKLSVAGFTQIIAMTEGNVSGANYAERAEVLDTAISNLLDICDQYNIKYYVKDWTFCRLAVITEGVAEYDSGNYEQIVSDILSNVDYINHPAYAGNLGHDEPTVQEMELIKLVLTEYVKFVDQNALYLANILPSYAEGWQFGIKSGSGDSAVYYTYEEYVDKFVELIGNDIGYISVDIYPLVDSGVREDYLYNLSVVANTARDNGLFYNVYIDAGYEQERSQAEIAYQVNSALAFGAKSISYFTYKSLTQNSFDSASIVNSYVHAMENAYLYYSWNGVLYNGITTNGIARGNMIEGALELSDIACLSDTASTTDTLIGCFANNSNEALMVVNSCEPDDNTIDNITLTFTDATSAIVYHNGTMEIVEFANGVYSFTLNAGEASFIIPIL